jgi:hypothetical protein
MPPWLLMSMIFMGTISAGQQKDTLGDFTKSPTEHIVIQIEQPFVVQSVKGVISRETSGPAQVLQHVLFEIQGPDPDRRIRRAATDEKGQFKIGHIPFGRYKFKATLNGFQSVTGTIAVSKEAPENNEIKIAMPIGV